MYQIWDVIYIYNGGEYGKGKMKQRERRPRENGRRKWNHKIKEEQISRKEVRYECKGRKIGE